jgi:hypothetical protein
MKVTCNASNGVSLRIKIVLRGFTPRLVLGTREAHGRYTGMRHTAQAFRSTASADLDETRAVPERQRVLEIEG